ncbi:MAG: DUF192 domain-containing protein [Erysipelotrichaceae bacterium]|nr:DUF192 domain-containing protein [Erysipelotrichaceae bacterium]
MNRCELYVNDGSFTIDAEIADSFLTRFKGLMLRKNLGQNEGLLLKQCGSIHCCFMRFTIDVVYLNAAYEVLKVETVKPWRVGSLVKGAVHVLEVNEHVASGLKEGMKLGVKETDHG